jgi:hypothetical protein
VLLPACSTLPPTPALITKALATLGPCESGDEHTAFRPRSISAMTGPRGICKFAGFSNHPDTGIRDPKCWPATRP